MSLTAELEAVLERLGRATYADGEKVRVVSDPGHIDTPCIYLAPPNLTGRFDRGQVDATWEAFCCAAPNQEAQTLLEQHAAMLDALARLGLPLTEATLYDLPVPGGPTTIAYRVTWNAARLKIGD